MREFDTGATRGSEENKYDYEGFISPFVLERYGKYMHAHRVQADGNPRDSDNWQKGMSQESYAKSLIRHVLDFWRVRRGGTCIDPEREKTVTLEELACAIMFNIMGWLHEELKNEREGR
jgi:hypothetical protein